MTEQIFVGYCAGSAFKMADVPVREQLGRGAAQKATLSLRRKSAARQGTPLAGLNAAGLTPGRGKAPGTPLSAAGKRLLSNLRGGTPSGNAQLRASYKTQTPGVYCTGMQPCRWWSALMCICLDCNVRPAIKLCSNVYSLSRRSHVSMQTTVWP